MTRPNITDTISVGMVKTINQNITGMYNAIEIDGSTITIPLFPSVALIIIKTSKSLKLPV